MMRRLLLGSVVAFTACLGGWAYAQQQDNLSLGAVITNTAQIPATVTSSALVNSSNSGVTCTYVRTASSGSPSTTFSIQYQDTASATWISLLTSGAIVDGAAHTLVVYPGIQTSSLPTNFASINLKLPRNWRISETVATSSSGDTGTIGCDLLK